MNWKLSFCEIEQLSDNIFEVTVNEGHVIDEKSAEEARLFWHNLRKEPYNLLVNNKNNFSYSFIGMQEIASQPLERKTAVLLDEEILIKEISMVVDLEKMLGNVENKKVFQDREEAIKWLKAP